MQTAPTTAPPQNYNTTRQVAFDPAALHAPNTPLATHNPTPDTSKVAENCERCGGDGDDPDWEGDCRKCGGNGKA